MYYYLSYFIIYFINYLLLIIIIIYSVYYFIIYHNTKHNRTETKTATGHIFYTLNDFGRISSGATVHFNAKRKSARDTKTRRG